MERNPKIIIVALCTLRVTHAAGQTTVPPKDQAKRMLERLTGVRWPSESPLLQNMTTLIQEGKRLEAAQIATSQPQFYNVCETDGGTDVDS